MVEPTGDDIAYEDEELESAESSAKDDERSDDAEVGGSRDSSRRSSKAGSRRSSHASNEGGLGHGSEISSKRQSGSASDFDRDSSRRSSKAGSRRISHTSNEGGLGHGSEISSKRQSGIASDFDNHPDSDRRTSIRIDTAMSFAGDSNHELEQELDETPRAKEVLAEVSENEDSDHYWSEFAWEGDSERTTGLPLEYDSKQFSESSWFDALEAENSQTSFVKVARKGPLQRRLTTELQISPLAAPEKLDWRGMLALSKNVVSSEGSAKNVKNVRNYRFLRSSSSLNFGLGDQPSTYQETVGGSMSSKQEVPQESRGEANNVWLDPGDFAFLSLSPPKSKTHAYGAASKNADVSQDVLEWHVWNLSREHENMLLDFHDCGVLQDTQKRTQIQDLSMELLQMRHGCLGLVQAEAEALTVCAAEALHRKEQFQSSLRELHSLEDILQAMQKTPAGLERTLEEMRCLRSEISSKDSEIFRLEEHLASLRRFSSAGRPSLDSELCDDSYNAKITSSTSVVSDTLSSFPRLPFMSPQSCQLTDSNAVVQTSSSSDASDSFLSKDPLSELAQLREEIQARVVSLRARRAHCGSRHLSEGAQSPPTLIA